MTILDDVTFKDDLLKKVFDANLRILGIVGSYNDPVAARQAAEQILAALNRLDKQNALHAENEAAENLAVEEYAAWLMDPLSRPSEAPVLCPKRKTELQTGEACPHQRRNLRPLRGRARLAPRIG